MKVFKAGVVAVAIGLAAVGCAQTPKRSSLVVGESGCQSGRFDVYFVENQARLTDAAQLLLNTAAEKARQCRVAKVRVLGLADAAGASEANMTLSQQRGFPRGHALPLRRRQARRCARLAGGAFPLAAASRHLAGAARHRRPV